MKDRSGPPSVKRYFLGCWSLASGTHFSVKFIPFRLRAKLRDVAVILKLFFIGSREYGYLQPAGARSAYLFKFC